MKLINQLVKYWALLGGLLLLTIIFVTAYNVTMFGADKLATALFDKDVTGFSGYEEYVRMAISCVALMFFPWCHLRDGHVSVDILYHRFPDWMKVGVNVLNQVLIIIMCIFLVTYMWDGMFEVKADGIITTVLGWSEWPFYIPGMISLVLWALVAVVRLQSIITTEKA